MGTCPAFTLTSDGKKLFWQNGDRMKLKMMANSDAGTVRLINEDFCGIFEEDGLAVVCDGMGGHNAGAQASRLAVATIRYMYLFLDPTVHHQITKDLIVIDLNIATRLIGSIRFANRNVYNKSVKDPKLTGMGTTVSALAIQDGAAVLAHVGDSRIYRFRDGEMSLLTNDHTWINELIQDQEIDHEDARKFEKQNVITRALGLTGSIKIDVGIEPIRQGDLFLICTDGLIKALTDDEIKRIVQFNKNNFDHTLQHLIDTANMKDGSDNITIVLVLIEELEPVQTIHQPIYLTLKAESKQTSHLEDRILKHEIHSRTNSEWNGGPITKVIKDKYIKLSGIVVSLILVIFIGMYAFSNHIGKQNSNPVVDVQSETFSIVAKDSLQIPGIINNQLDQDLIEPPLESDTTSLPDSVINSLIIDSMENQGNTGTVSKLRSRSLQKNIQNRGLIYLTELKNPNHIEHTLLFINNKYWGKTIDFWNKGLLLCPGIYTIMICDTTNAVLYQKKNIKVLAGNVKAIEMKGQ